MSGKILGLDLGTNSIGWALIDQDQKKILGMGSRIIPMDASIMGDFDKGNSVSQTAERTRYRSTRKGYERHHLRRERLHRVLKVLGFLPEHYVTGIDFRKRFGKFIEDTEPKLVWKKNGQKENGKNKFEFLFQSSFNEMIEDFKKTQSELLNRKNKKGEEPKIPYDWTIYYLRKKALTDKISKEELAWLILNFNKKRGYYQARGEDDETTDKREYVEVLKIVKIEKGEVDQKNDKRTWYSLTLSNGWIYSATFTAEPQWLNTEKEFLVTEELDENGNIKIVKNKKTDTSGKEKRKITLLPSFEEIDLMSKADQDKIYKKIKAKTELTISNSEKTVGAYIYDTLLRKPTQKIRGKLVRTIERKFYKNELRQILQKQIALQPELFTEEMYNNCVQELYPSNEAHQLTLSKRDFAHLFLDDIIFYHRPLRSQKSSIGNCSLEFVMYKSRDKNGMEIEVKDHLKATPKSNPYYQEFRLWQWIRNLSIYRKEGDSNVTAEFISSVEDFEKLFEFLNDRKEIEQKPLIKFLVERKQSKLKPKEVSTEVEKYRWNYVEDKKYPSNETRSQIVTRLEKVANIPTDFLETTDTKEITNKKGNKEIVSLGTREYQIWHIIYSVTDKVEFEKALKSFANKYNVDESSFVESFRKFPPFPSDYGSYSEKAIKKLLPLLRLGKYWNWEAIDGKTQERINKIVTGEFDKNIKNRVREKTINLTELNDFQGLPEWLAKYVVYDRHSEAGSINQWQMSFDIQQYLYDFRQHSLRNPIVEQVVTETLRVVKDIWENYAEMNNEPCEMVYDEHKKKKVKCYKKFFDEIHIELGREMKNTAEERARITNQITENENTNLRIKLLLAELKNDNSIDGVREYSPMQQQILKIYEDGVLSKYSENELKREAFENIGKDEAKNVFEVSSKAQPNKSELQRYKLWLEQKYRSPYTGRMIPLNKLFSTAYEVEHIIPQSRYFDDSFNNKVICEAAVNTLKDNQLGLEFIKKHHGQIIETGSETIKIFSEDEYKDFVKENYDNNRGKSNKLLLEEIPDKMIERQLNDTRYISKYISSVLSNIVRVDKDDDGVNSKNIIPGNGKITDRLKKDWGLNDVWNELVLPRFKRMNELTKTNAFTSTNKEGHTIPTIPLELSKGFQKKRIDHRHHALDALVVACATRDHVNLLNNQSAKSDTKRYDLQHKLRRIEKWRDKNGNERDKFTEFKKPWENFTTDAKNELEKIVVSFKQNLRVINKATNHYEKIENNKKVKIEQKGVNWAIRKPMHKAFVFGRVDLPWVQVPKGKNNVAIRRSLDTSFNEDKIKTITDTGIQKILINYLNAKGDKPDIAFSPEGIEDLNRNIANYNDGKQHQPIYKVRTFEIGSRFPLGTTGNKKDKYVETADGVNLFFAVYARKDNKERMFDTVPLNEVIEHQKLQVATNLTNAERTAIPHKKTLEFKGKEIEVQYLFHLSPNDLVYVPTADEMINGSKVQIKDLTNEQRQRIYKFTDGSGTIANFIPLNIANVLFNMNKEKQKKAFGKEMFFIQNEIGVGSQGSKNQNATTGEQIKAVCIKLKVDRLGNIRSM